MKRCFQKSVKISQENALVEVLFNSCRLACNFIEIRDFGKVFLWEFYKISQINSFAKNIRATASEVFLTKCEMHDHLLLNIWY